MNSLLDRLRGIKQMALRLTRRKSSAMTDAYVAAEMPHANTLKKLLGSLPRPVIFDIGACEALDSIRYARLFPTAVIHAFEPLKGNVRRARMMMRRYNCPEIYLHRLALSDQNGTLALHRSYGAPENLRNREEWDFGNKSSSLLEPDGQRIGEEWPWLRYKSAETVPSVTVENFCKTNAITSVDFIHLDVQGAELLVLRGAGDILTTVRAIWLEVSSVPFYHTQPLADEVARFLEERDFVRVLRAGTEPQWDELWCRQLEN